MATKTDFLSFAAITLGLTAVLIGIASTPVFFGRMVAIERDLLVGKAEFESAADSAWTRLMEVRRKKGVPKIREEREAQTCKCDAHNSCPPGPPGPPGSNGVDGEEGRYGHKGSEGLQNPLGASVATSPAISSCRKCPPGRKGQAGTIGIEGPTGAKGFAGTPGKEGIQGQTGSPGAVGNRGCSGPPGKQGEKGKNGDDAIGGQKGPPGPRGEPGEVGPQGPVGDRGSIGRPSEAGVGGPQGAPGHPGAPAVDGIRGPRGLTGAPGLDASYCPCPSPKIPPPISGYGIPQKVNGHGSSLAPVVPSINATNPPEAVIIGRFVTDYLDNATTVGPEAMSGSTGEPDLVFTTATATNATSDENDFLNGTTEMVAPNAMNGNATELPLPDLANTEATVNESSTTMMINATTSADLTDLGSQTGNSTGGFDVMTTSPAQSVPDETNEGSTVPPSSPGSDSSSTSDPTEPIETATLESDIHELGSNQSSPNVPFGNVSTISNSIVDGEMETSTTIANSTTVVATTEGAPVNATVPHASEEVTTVGRMDNSTRSGTSPFASTISNHSSTSPPEASISPDDNSDELIPDISVPLE